MNQSIKDRCNHGIQWLWVGLMSIAIVACGVDDTERLARAQDAFAAGDYREAVIDAKSILQRQNDNSAARVLLGRASLATGDAAGAEQALRRAVADGADPATVAVDLARALLLQRKYTDLLADLSADDVTATADKFAVRLARADAQMGLGLSRTARAAYQQLISEDPDTSAARLGVASSYVIDNDLPAARQTLDELTRRDPDFVPGWLSSGSVAMKAGDFNKAANEYRSALDAATRAGNKSAAAEALAGLLETQLSAADKDAAAQTLEQLRQSSPNALVTRYLGARVDFDNGNFDTAGQTLAELLREAPAYGPARLLMGATQLRLGNVAQADTYVASLLRDVPDSGEARLLLAEIRLRQGRGDEVAEIIKPALAAGTNRDALLALAIRGGMQSGQYSSTLELLRQRLADDPENTQAALELAGALMAAGEIGDAEVILRQTDDGSDATEMRKEMLAVYASLQRGDNEQALQQAQRVARQRPDNAAAQSLLANVALASGRLKLARASFAATQRLDPASIATYLAVARMDVEAGDIDAARAELIRAREAAPTETIVPVALANLELREGNVAAARAVLESAILDAPEAPLPRLAFAEVALRGNDPSAALAAAEAVIARDPANAIAHNLAGVAAEREGDATAAAQHFANAVESDPANSVFRINAARAYAATEQFAAAEAVLLDAGRVPIEDVQRATALISLKAKSGDLKAARALVKDLKANHPGSVAPLAVEGRLAAASGDFATASRAYDEALELSQYERGIVLMAHNVRTAGALDDPDAPLLRYLEKSPDDLAVLAVLAQSYTRQGRRAEAIRVYERALAAAPDNVTIINNLAWEYTQAGDARAEALAQRGYAANKGNADMTDTYGWILYRNGNNDAAIERLREALALAPANAAIQYHLGAALARDGATDEAIALLEQALTGSAAFPGRDAASALRDSL